MQNPRYKRGLIFGDALCAAMAGFVEGFADSANFSGYGLRDFEIKFAMIANKCVFISDPEGSLAFGTAHHLEGAVFQRHMNIAP